MKWWNWKAALLSAVLRSLLFFFMTIWAGLDRALTAFFAELIFRGATSGIYGGIIQSIRDVRPQWIPRIVALVILPVVAHTLEYVVHLGVGTPFLGASILV